MIHCEDCQYYTERFDIDDFGEYFDICECMAYVEPIDCTDKISCPCYTPIK